MSENIAMDLSKAVELLPLVVSTISAGQTTMTNDQHTTVLQKGLDLLGVAGNSATALAGSGVIGSADAQHVKDAVAAVEGTESLWAPISAAVAALKKAIGWL